MGALRSALRVRGVALLLGAWTLSRVSAWAFGLVLLLYAHDVGGATAASLAVVVLAVPAGLAAPATAALADRFSRRSALLASALLRTLLHAGTGAAIALDGSFALVLTLAAASSVVSTVHRPAHLALLPEVIRTPAQLAAANGATSTGDYVGFLVGSLGAGLLAEAGGLPLAVWVDSAVLALAGVCYLGLRRGGSEQSDGGTPSAGRRSRTSLAAGLLLVASTSDLRLLTGLGFARHVVMGALDVMLVVAALELLGTGPSGAGLLSAAWGVGGLVGGVLALGALPGARLSRGMFAGLLLVAAPLGALGLLASPVVAPSLLVVVGIGLALVEVALLTLTQRLAPTDVLGRVFGVLEVLAVAGTALGATLASLLVGGFGPGGSLSTLGAVVAVLAAVTGVWIVRIGREAVAPEDTFLALRGSPVFAGLSVAAVETLALRTRERTFEPDDVLLREGDRGDTLYVVASGSVDVASRERGHLATLGVGDHVGEIALLHDLPRTATVTARAPTRVLALDRDHFLAAVSGHQRSLEVVDEIAARRLAETVG